MRLLTCTGCVMNGACAHAPDLRAKLKGLGIRTVKFACKHRRDLFLPGHAVLFTTFITEEWDGDYGGGSERTQVSYPGHVIKQMGSKVFGFIKPGVDDASGEGIPFEPKANGFVKMPISRVKLDERREPADVTECRWCSRFIALGHSCEKDQHYTPPGKCLADQMAAPLAKTKEAGNG